MTKPGDYSGGPAYIGAIIFILAIIGFVVVKNTLKWPLLIISVLAVLMSWGSYFFGFNEFLFNSLPLYNKFRAPSMALVICQLTLPLMAVITIYSLFLKKKCRGFLKSQLQKNIIYAWRNYSGIGVAVYRPELFFRV